MNLDLSGLKGEGIQEIIYTVKNVMFLKKERRGME